MKATGDLYYAVHEVELQCTVCKTRFSAKLTLDPTRITCPNGHDIGDWRLDPENLRGVRVNMP